MGGWGDGWMGMRMGGRMGEWENGEWGGGVAAVCGELWCDGVG